ncbi:histidinol dehydrogenase [Treponema parvum]|uniref:Histidinol dehydrogenase n=1 Tax=Treponema parvum TaxID=138851 RepID=A0A975IDJ9_9SPIR|nr:histidinol dehydrogenase [Treponema parvum]QTQ13020.1 histidinol dehydrogenase [Treponema parvum]
MIKIQKACELESDFFAVRDFGSSLETVKTILSDVKVKKDFALHEYAKKFDAADPAVFEIPQSDLKAAAKKMEKQDPALYEALSYSRDLALEFAKKQKESFGDFEIELRPGLFTGQRTVAVEKVGAYVPAGRFPLLSTVIMTVMPAKAAGVKETIICTPPRVHPDDLKKAGNVSAETTSSVSSVAEGISGKAFSGGKPYADEGIMAAAYICGTDRVFACGGAQAIAAMAFGTQSVPQVDVIVGPGNKFVAEAKKLVYGAVGLDMAAGPTEVFIIADSSANPKWIAADLLAQAEHDVVAQPVLATPSREFAFSVAAEIEKQLETLQTKNIARESIDNFGRIIITESLEQAADIANRKAPEHLELAIDEDSKLDKIEKLVHNYGSLFIGHSSAEVLGDYAAGINHTLPTSGSARFTGGLSVRCFLKTVTTLRTKPGYDGVNKSAKVSACLGDAEGLFAHAQAARLRIRE